MIEESDLTPGCMIFFESGYNTIDTKIVPRPEPKSKPKKKRK